MIGESTPSAVSSTVARVAMEVVIAGRKKSGQQIVQAGCGPAAVAERLAAAEEENAAAATIDILAQQFLLQAA